MSEVDELKAYVEGVLHGKVITEQMGYCKRCGRYEDLRFGLCFDCVFPKCPLESCSHRKLVFNAKRERVWKNLQYIGKDGKVYCDRLDGLCATAKNFLRRLRNHESQFKFV